MNNKRQAMAVAVRWYKKATAPLNETARAQLREEDNGGSPPSPEGEGEAELADLIDSFYDEDGGEDGESRRHRWFSSGNKVDGDDEGGTWRYELEGVLAELRADAVAVPIRVAAEAAVRMDGAGGVAQDLKRKVAVRLQEKGFDAGLCTSSWEKTDGFKAGTHEYVDVVVSGGAVRYIVELNIAAEFEIARPSGDYAAFLRSLPAVFVGRPDALRNLVRLMCAAAEESIACAGMYVPPWRRSGYVLGKWFSPYKRTITLPTTTYAVFPVPDDTRRREATEGRGPTGGRAMRTCVKGKKNKFCRAAFGCRELPQATGV